MKSENLSSNNTYKGSAFGISGMWMKTLVRRDFLIVFVAFLAYFSACILPLILNYSEFIIVSDYYKHMMSGGSFAVPTITVCYVISLSVMMFDYLHQSASAAALHSFPVTRGKLFRTTVLAGMLFILLPIVLVAVGMAALGFVMPLSHGSNGIADPHAVLSIVNCLKFVVDTSVGAFFVFAIANLAGIVAGKSIIHALLAYLLNSIVVIVLGLINIYQNAFILGAQDSDLIDLAKYTYPFLWYTSERSAPLGVKDIPMMLVFVAVAVIITILAGALYKIIKLEREQSATVFPLVSDLLVIFLSFCGMSVFGLVFAAIVEGDTPVLPLKPFLLGCAFGGVISFIVFRMIADSSVRIIRPRTFVNFIAFCLVTAAVFAFTCFDITGQADRVPQAKDVTSVEITAMRPFENTIELSESQSIEDVIKLHKAILAHKDRLNGDEDIEDVGPYVQLTMKYKLKNGLTLSRSYSAGLKGLSDVVAAASALSDNEEYQTKVRQLVLKAGRKTASSRYIQTNKAEVEIAQDDVGPLLLAYLNDCEENDYKYYLDLLNEIPEPTGTFKENRQGTICIFYEYTDTPDVVYDMNLQFGKKDKNVYKFLKERGYTKKIADDEKTPDIESED